MMAADAKGEIDAAHWRDLNTERCVIGQILRFPDTAAKFAECGCSRESFSDPAHQAIFKAIDDVRQDGLMPDLPAVGTRLRESQRADVPPAYLADLVSGVPKPAPANITAQVERLTTLARCRRYFYDGQKLLGQLAHHPELINDGLPGHHVELLQALQAAGPTDRYALPLLDDVALLNREAPPEMIDGRLPCEALAVLYGQSGIGKSYVALSLACAVASGRPWLGARVRHKGPVVYIAGEGINQLQKRIRTWKAFNGFNLDAVLGVYVLPDAVQLRDPQKVEAFIRTVEHLRPVLVIPDTLARCAEGVNENDAGEMGLVIGGADRIRKRLGCTVMLLHHSTKSGETERGSGALRAATDVMWHLRDNNDLLTLECAKQKDTAEFEAFGIRLVPQDDGGCIVKLAIDSPESTEPTVKDVTALRALAESFGENGARFGEWERVAGVPARSFARVVRHLQTTGLVSQIGQLYRLTDQARERLS